MTDRRRMLMTAQGGEEPVVPPVEFPFAGTTWHTGTGYDLTTGNFKSEARKSCTDKYVFETAAWYEFATPTTWCAICIWDENDNFIFSYERQYQDSLIYTFVKPGWKYAINIYTNVQPHLYEEYFHLYEAESPIARTTINLWDRTWVVSNNWVTTQHFDVFPIVKRPAQYIRKSNHPLMFIPDPSSTSQIKKWNAPELFVFATSYGNEDTLAINVAGKDVAQTVQYLIENNITLVIN